MDKTKKKKVQMPSGIRSKLTAAVAMLLISSLLVVGSTYAWFTLSTAPEVSGITTSVGANGNLEIALLTSGREAAEGVEAIANTYGNTSLISSAIGDSSATQALTKANITWGNLVDLSDTSYNLSGISLMPAQLNNTDNTVSTGSFLKTPVYGVDGRVADLEANTVSAVYANGAFTYDSAKPTYGVRAIGVASNLTARQIAFNTAKSSVTSNVNSAPRAVASAVNRNAIQFALIAISGEPDNYSNPQLAAMGDMAQGAKSSLESIVKAYANAGLAKAASASGAAADETGDAQVTTLQTAIASVTSASALKTLLNAAGVSSYDGVLDTLATAQSGVQGAIDALATYNDKTSGSTVKTNVVAPLIGGSDTIKAFDESGVEVTPIGTGTVGRIKTMYLNGGAIGTIAAQTGNIKLTNSNGIDVYGGSKETPTNALAGVASAVSNLSAPAGAATSNISDTYGYVIDFAFRTNAANSNLQLQTSAVNRVYEDGGNATQGGGSKVTFTYTNGLTFTQAQKLLGAINLVFLNPEDGTIYKQATLTNIADNDTHTAATADVKLSGQTGNTGTITGLNQNEVKKVSVLVYLDGTKVDNSAVISADASGSLDLNLQFSSSETLVPMKNTALQTMN